MFGVKTSSMLTKSNLLINAQCSRRLWLSINRSQLEEKDPDSAIKITTGIKVGLLARSLYPDGKLINTLNKSEALTLTKEIMAREANQPIFEAAFEANNVLVRVDLLIPENEGYRLVEVKGSSSEKSYYLDDIAIQTWVMRKAGINPTKLCLSYINNGFIYQGNNNYKDFFNEVDLTNKIEKKVSLVSQWVDNANATLELKEEPKEIKIGSHCSNPFTCSFIKHCSSFENPTEYPISLLPRAGKLINELKSEGYEDIRDIPDGRLTNDDHIRMRRISISGKAELNLEAKKELNKLPYPRYYLDFETISYVVPEVPNTKPYCQIPFQWSCHIQDEDKNVTHCEFLDDEHLDPRREFALSLINLLKDAKTIFVYSSFEKSRINELAVLFPDLKEGLNSIVNKLYDLLNLTRDHYYHPEMKGSWSIKKVLPTLSSLNYSKLTIQNGSQAQVAYLNLMNPKTSYEDKHEIKNNLLKYCKLDTEAMLEITKGFDIFAYDFE